MHVLVSLNMDVCMHHEFMYICLYVCACMNVHRETCISLYTCMHADIQVSRWFHVGRHYE